MKERSRRPDLPVDEVVGLVKFSTLVMRERGTPEIGSPAGRPEIPPPENKKMKNSPTEKEFTVSIPEKNSLVSPPEKEMGP